MQVFFEFTFLVRYILYSSFSRCLNFFNKYIATTFLSPNSRVTFSFETLAPFENATGPRQLDVSATWEKSCTFVYSFFIVFLCLPSLSFSSSPPLFLFSLSFESKRKRIPWQLFRDVTRYFLTVMYYPRYVLLSFCFCSNASESVSRCVRIRSNYAFFFLTRALGFYIYYFFTAL